MKKILILSFILGAWSLQAWSNVVTGQAAIPDNYYVSVNNLSSAESILDALYNKLDNHTIIPYKSLEPYYEQTDFYADTVWDMYSTCHFTYEQANNPQSEVCDGWNKEHSIPQSWFNEGSPMKSDLFHVYPTDARVNNFRSNYPYGEVAGGNGTGFKDNKGGHGLGKLGSNTFAGYTGKVFEPADEYKGDLARTYFYMVARYRNKSFTSDGGDAVFTSNKTNLTTFAKNLFLKWHRQDPVSQKEIDRNQAVYGIQKNRNPFIDYPDLAEYIWGDKVGQKIDLSSMTPTCETGGTMPVVPVKFGINWFINGELLRVDSVKENNRPAALPDKPQSCSSESNVFVGWTDAAISGISDEAPTVLYKEVKDIPAVKEDVTYYAVFAHEEIVGGSTPAVYTFDASNSQGWDNKAFKSGTYWILRTGLYLESPEIDLAGLTSITMNMRTYGGASYNTVNVTANNQQITTLTAESKTLKEQTWTNTASLSGLSTLRFTSANATDQYGVAFDAVTINATGAGAVHSRFITSCQETTEVQWIPADQPARKMLVGQQIYILVGEQMFNIQGQRVK